MSNTLRYFVYPIAMLITSGGTAFAGTPLGVQLGSTLGTSLPIAEGGLLGLAVAGVVAGVWLARRKH